MLCLIRHGETAANQARLYAGLKDYELTSTGRAQAARIGDFILSTLSDALLIDRLIVSSPLPRARQTAEIIAGALPGTEVVTDSRILEVDYGQLDGTPIRKGVSFADEAQQKDGGIYRVEPISNIQQRAGEFLADHVDYLDPQSNKLKLAVGHGALWSVIPFLVQSRPLSEVKIQKNYEVVLLTADEVEIIDTRAVDPSPRPSSFEALN